MSHAGRTPLPAPTPWRIFPLAAIAALGVVVAVNGVLAWAALISRRMAAGPNSENT